MAEQKARLRTRLKHVNNQDLLNTGFWITNVCMIVATIIGVFLASNEGFRQAMTFDDINTTEANYYLRRSMLLELEDNLVLVQHQVDILQQAQYKRYDPSRDDLALDHYVWKSMQYSANTMEVPSHLLAGVRRYYRQIERIWRKMAAHQISTQQGLEQVIAANNEVEQQLIPGIRADLKQLRQDLADYQVEVK
ncbi:hypothetical protein K6Y31_13875 [Motilimonas cestriensis]|uniref:Methyl-accepting chemotaxis protein n=1 Tax=Motilimonas cestriensis TaxID=2742685 RepID=A0ABS8WA58_9GAMM|nr:hypothetical protein [Motilimonas cestriensis]MCE2595897.1 hypothetical protein [Motilimonas cestriensis]